MEMEQYHDDDDFLVSLSISISLGSIRKRLGRSSMKQMLS